MKDHGWQYSAVMLPVRLSCSVKRALPRLFWQASTVVTGAEAVWEMLGVAPGGPVVSLMEPKLSGGIQWRFLRASNVVTDAGSV